MIWLFLTLKICPFLATWGHTHTRDFFINTLNHPHTLHSYCTLCLTSNTRTSFSYHAATGKRVRDVASRSTFVSVTCTALDFTPMFVLTGNVRISDLGLAVELADDQFKIKGYAGTPGTVRKISTKLQHLCPRPELTKPTAQQKACLSLSHV